MRIGLSWGHQSASPRGFRIGFSSNPVAIVRVGPEGLETTDTLDGGVAETQAGGGDVDGVIAEVSWQEPVQPCIVDRETGSVWLMIEEEFLAMFHSQQQPDGRVGGYAEWGVYSPGMLYSIGQNFLLSADRSFFERLLPASLKALDWCLGAVAQGRSSQEAPGLVVAPLNDLTHDARA